MSARGVLSPLTNTPISSRRPPANKYVSPSTCRQPGLGALSPSGTLLTETHDDEKERRDRRRSRILEIQRNYGTSPGGSPSDRRGTPLNGLTSTQLAEHYTNCIQLSAENKINSKNAFGLHLIDYMGELLKKKELENFQVASSTLDASAKIYAGRVDFIHSETYKVLSGLGTGSQKPKNDDGESMEDADGPEQQGEEQKKKKKRKSRTVETNLKNINIKFDLEFEVDPMFQMMSATFDEGGASGLLLNHLRCYDDQQLLMLDSGAIVPVVDDKTEGEIPDSQVHSQPKPLEVQEVRNLLATMQLEDKHICPALEDFKLTGWDASADTSTMLPKGLSEFAFDPHTEPEPASSVEDDFGSLHNISDGEDGADDDVGGEENLSEHISQMKGDSRTAEFIQNAFDDLTHGNTGKLLQILASQPTDYSYFNKVLMRTWAGPTHWKTAPMSRDPSLRSLTGNSQRSKTKRQPFQLTYENGGDLDSKFKASKATALTKATMQKYSKKKTTLPKDLHFEADKLCRLFLRQKIMIKRQVTDAIGVDDGIQNYDYDNANDRENYCPDIGGDDDGDVTPDLGFNFSDDSRGFDEGSQMSPPSLAANDSGLNATSLTGDKLLSQPYKVAKIDINYAKTAKRVDFRKLKTAMWSLLVSQPETQQEEDGSASNASEKEMKREWGFQSLLQALPSHLSGSTARNLSIPMAFLCLLQLANEKMLKLSDLEMADLQIDQDV